MILECCRIISDYLSNGTNGVNALLATTPLDAGDTVPANLLSILDATRDGNVARGRLPASLPGLAVTAERVENILPHVVTNDAEMDVTVLIRLGMTAPQTETAFRNISYYLRTIVRSLRRFNTNQDPTVRIRNGVYLESCEQLDEFTLWQVIDDSVVTGGVLARYHVRDQGPVT